jgi:4-hydroxythreonine-4-phosphate dehydrogenase
VTLAALSTPAVRRALVPVVFGDAAWARKVRGFDVVESLPVRPARATWVCVTSLPAQDRAAGKPTPEGGRAQLRYVMEAVRAAQDGLVDALCTAPVSKEQINRGGTHFVGHTELLAELFAVEVMMLMDGPRLKVALATNHVALADVSALITRERLTRQLQLLSSALPRKGARPPRIAVCALNPHAGDGGTFGREDLDVVQPAVQDAQAAGVRCEGPFAADGLFAHGAKGFDAVLALYHDQGLIPAKALDFAKTVNVTLGLPIPRTSPDHGVAYDIAGRGRADPRPMATALLHAARLSSLRTRKKRAPRAVR